MISEYIERLKARRYSPKTIALYELEFRTFEKLGRDLKKIAKHLEKCAPATHARKLTIWKNYLKSVGDPLLDSFEVPKVRQRSFLFLSDQEIKKLIEASKTFSLELQLFLEIGLAIGLRISEIMQVDSSKLDGDWLKIIRKGGGGQNIPVTESLKTKIQDFDGFHFTQNYYRKKLTEMCKLAGISKRITPHKLRHTFATHKMEAGCSIVTMRDMLGHTNISVTNRYCHVTPGALLKLVRGNNG